MENLEKTTEIRILKGLIVLTFRNQPHWYCIIMTLIIIGSVIAMLHFILPSIHTAIPNNTLKNVGKLIKGASP